MSKQKSEARRGATRDEEYRFNKRGNFFETGRKTIQKI
jgi:hypothetical protein